MSVRLYCMYVICRGFVVCRRQHTACLTVVKQILLARCLVTHHSCWYCVYVSIIHQLKHILLHVLTQK